MTPGKEAAIKLFAGTMIVAAVVTLIVILAMTVENFLLILFCVIFGVCIMGFFAWILYEIWAEMKKDIERKRGL